MRIQFLQDETGDHATVASLMRLVLYVCVPVSAAVTATIYIVFTVGLYLGGLIEGLL